jgi:two-component system, LuxR family, sensor kinase FixL
MRHKIISLRVYLFILLLCTVTPITIYAAWLVLHFAKGERQSIESGIRDTNRALITALDREFESSIAALNVLATSKLLDTGNYRQFYALCERARATQAGWKSIILHDPSGKPFLNLLVPFGKPLPPLVGKESFKKVLRTKKAAILELVKGPKGHWTFGVRVPVLRRGEVKYVLSAIIEASHVGAIMREQKLPSSWLGIIHDQERHLVARTRSTSKFIGQKAAMLKMAPRGAMAGSLRSAKIDGVASYSFFRRSPFSGWYVVLNVPAELLDRPVEHSILTVVGVGLIALLFGGLFAISMSRRINHSVAGIRTLAQALGLKQRIGQIEQSPVSELITITEALYDASKLLQEGEAKQRQAEQELREVNDRLEQRVSERTATLEQEMRKKESLEESLRNQALLLQLTHDAIIVRSFDGAKIQFWNNGAAQVYGWSTEEAVGKVVHKLLCSRYQEPLNEIESKVARTGRWEGELIQTRKDGTEIILESRWSVRRSPDGRPLEILQLNSDITSKKYAEQKAQENEWLAGVGTMTAIFAHEIGNPLHSISTSLELVERQLEGKLKPGSRLKKTLELSSQEIQRVSALLREFRAFARPQIGNFQLTNLVDLIKDVLVPQTVVCRKAGIKIKPLFEELRPTLIDRDKMKQVILNLCKNAIEAMPDGGVLTIRTHQAEDIGILEISDTGVGIPQEVDVFQLFTTTKSNGTGLGLPLVRQIIAAHQGTVHYTSEAGQGTTFRICLRARSNPDGSNEAQPQEAGNPGAAQLEVRQAATSPT